MCRNCDYTIFRRVLSCIVCIHIAISTFISSAQTPTNLYLFSLHQSADGLYHLSDPKYLSDFNPGGYTNQPFFTSNSEMIVSVRKTNESQNDIWSLSLSTWKLKRLTHTTANEYSPRLTPDGKYYSVLRQVPGEPIDQQIFRFPVKGGTYTSLTPGIKDIGYYTWLSADGLAWFKIEGEQNRLVLYNLEDRITKQVTSSIGRSLQADEKGAVCYVHMYSDTFWYLKKYNQDSASIDLIAETPGKTEDFAMAPDGTFFMGSDSLLLFMHPGTLPVWKSCADLSVYGIHHITRLAISPDGTQLALVATKD